MNRGFTKIWPFTSQHAIDPKAQFIVFGHNPRGFGHNDQVIYKYEMIKINIQVMVEARNHPHVQSLDKNGSEVLGN